MRIPFVLGVVGVAGGAMGEFAPLAFPNTPQWVWATVFWCSAAIFAVAVIWLVAIGLRKIDVLENYHWHWTWKVSLERDDPWPLRRYMLLESAAQYAYGNLHETLITDVAEQPILGNAANPPHYIAGHMTSTLHLPLYGYKPYSRKLELIREEPIKWHNLSVDMTKLEDDTSEGKQTVYENLQMKRADVKKYINEQKVRK